jgi:hypothetical protein
MASDRPPIAALLALPAVLVAGSAVLVLLRARVLLRRPPAPLDPEAPLAPGELRRLRRWERRLRRALLWIGFGWLLLVGTWIARGELAVGDPRVALGLLGVLCLLGAIVQFSVRCPRCGYNLGFQSRPLGAEFCERCGGRFR